MVVDRSVNKCFNCRKSKLKCLPQPRAWEKEGGLRQKCGNCVKRNLQCGPNERKTKIENEQSGQNPKMAHNGGQEDGRLDVRGGMSRAKDERLDLKHRLKQTLKDVDILEEFVLLLWQATQDLAKRRDRLPPQHIYKNIAEDETLFEILTSMRLDLLAKLEAGERLVENLLESGALDAAIVAESAYMRVLQTYRSLPFSASAQFRRVLLKVASFHAENDERAQAEKLWREVLQLPDTPEGIKVEVWRQLSKSLPETSAQLTRIFNLKRAMFGTGSNVQIPFPPLHRAIRIGHECGTSTFPVEIQQGREHLDITGSPALHIGITRNLLPAFDLIKSCSIAELTGRESRDSYLRTPLFVAALSKQEGIGEAIMERFVGQTKDARQRLINDRDCMGQTIIAIAIMSDCSLPFIEKLIQFGAEADPQSLTSCVYTPLQAAALRGRLDVIKLLLDWGAKNGSVYFGEVTALQHAQAEGHYHIAELLRLTP